MSAKAVPDPVPEPPTDVGAAASGAAAPASSPPDELAAAKAAAAALEDRVRRQQADFVNETRRIQRQADERVKFAVQPVVSDLLSVADALHGAIEGLKDTEHERRVVEGLRLVQKELLDVLGRHGVAGIDAIGRPFDPAVHEAVLEMEGPGAPRTVLQVTRPGFTLHGRVVRPAHVIVSKAKPDGAPVGDGDAPAGRD
jgi:molecular chaperone GrpE